MISTGAPVTPFTVVVNSFPLLALATVVVVSTDKSKSSPVLTTVTEPSAEATVCISFNGFESASRISMVVLAPSVMVNSTLSLATLPAP